MQVVLDLHLDEAAIPEYIHDSHVGDAVAHHRDAHISQLLTDLSVLVASAQLIAERFIQFEDVVLVGTPDQ